MIVSIIAAIARNGVIGREGRLPWHLPVDLRRFREITTGHAVIMGRKTFEGLGHPLPDRTNIVLTRQSGFMANGVIVANSLVAALETVRDDEEVFICGGAEIYKQSLGRADRLYLTLIDADFEGDAFFPGFPAEQFVEVERIPFSNDPPGAFVLLERSSPPVLTEEDEQK